MPSTNPKSTPAPRPGTPLTVLVDAEFARDLTVLMRTGMGAAQAVGEAVNIVAGAYANAWQTGRIPAGVAPKIVGFDIAPPSTARNESPCAAQGCKRSVTQPVRGRPRRYCSPACRVRAHRSRKVTER
ncbi:CGNR zinc finger domain-containing protein [Streptomyces sp. N35]|uniref:CGNR zinc finger domain-containing protein n=1 Tax=Streptomyces sp. N35 TaxID=2795730 RepID=UPI0018F4C5A2|nr:CGNR zinc finger domain-containing protein [Streptomyces sp. N35]